jgi:cation:H+ antiporter
VFVALLVGIVALICSFPPRTGFIDRRRGVLLIAAYCIYLAVVLQQPTQ